MSDNIKDMIVGSRIRGEDGLDHMPAEIIDAIMSFIPLRDAAMMSQLSRQWRSSAKSIPALVFVYQIEWPTTLNDSLEHRMHSLLYMHHGVINKFGIQIRDNGYSLRHLKHYVPTLKAPGFTLHEIPFNQDDIAPDLYSSFQNLMHLYMFKCRFNPPPEYRGFTRLVTLNFNCVKLHTQAFAEFISLCLLLESVTLSDCIWSGVFEFEVPCLRFFRIWNEFNMITFKNTPLLSEVALSATSGDLKYFQFLPTLKILHLNARMLEVPIVCSRSCD